MQKSFAAALFWSFQSCHMILIIRWSLTTCDGTEDAQILIFPEHLKDLWSFLGKRLNIHISVNAVF